MRIISGTLGGRPIIPPKDNQIRPSSDKVRGAVFNMLQSYINIPSARVLDAFCGTGALGLEAISRGASQCIFIDNARESIRICKQNAVQFNVENQCTFIQSDADKGRYNAPFDLVFCDPPYGKNLIESTLDNLVLQQSCNPNCIFVLEEHKNTTINLPPPIKFIKEKTYRDTKITLARYQDE